MGILATLTRDLLEWPSIEKCTAEEFSSKVPALFDRAKSEILISTSGAKDFYEEKEVKGALERAIERGVEIKMLLDKDAEPVEWILNESQKGHIQLKRSKERIYHVIVVDGKHTRIEDIHDKENYKNAENDIFYNDIFMAEIFYVKFMKVWNSDIVEEIK